MKVKFGNGLYKKINLVDGKYFTFDMTHYKLSKFRDELEIKLELWDNYLLIDSRTVVYKSFIADMDWFTNFRKKRTEQKIRSFFKRHSGDLKKWGVPLNYINKLESLF